MPPSIEMPRPLPSTAFDGAWDGLNALDEDDVHRLLERLDGRAQGLDSCWLTTSSDAPDAMREAQVAELEEIARDAARRYGRSVRWLLLLKKLEREGVSGDLLDLAHEAYLNALDLLEPATSPSLSRLWRPAEPLIAEETRTALQALDRRPVCLPDRRPCCCPRAPRAPGIARP